MVIGLDAFDPDIAFGMVREGRLPTLAGLLESTSWARTLSPPGMAVGASWPSITTGCLPSRHGFYCDQQLAPGTYEAPYAGPRNITQQRLWSALASAGRRCIVLDAPITVPQPLPGGAQLVEWGAHDGFEPLSSEPPEFADEVVEQFGDYAVIGKCDDYARAGDYGGLRDALLRAPALKGELFSSLLDRDTWDFFFATFSESHCAGHQFWSNHDPTHPDHDPITREAYGDVILAVYEAIDASLGNVLTHIPDDASLMVLLSHGVGPHYDGEHIMAAILRALDAHEGTSRLLEVREQVVRGLQRRGRQARRALPLDSARRYFKVPNNEQYAGIRLNVKGREPRGRVAPGAEFEATIATLTAHLLEIENAETGEPLFTEILRTTDVYDGPLVDTLPDLLAGWNRASPIRAARSARIGVIRRDRTAIRNGDHRSGGLVLVRRPTIAPNEIPTPIPVVDLAPTIASWFDVELPGVDGRPVAEWAMAPVR